MRTPHSQETYKTFMKQSTHEMFVKEIREGFSSFKTKNTLHSRKKSYLEREPQKRFSRNGWDLVFLTEYINEYL